MTDILAEARRALEVERAGLTEQIQRLGPPFEQAVRMIFACKGKVVVTGVGKSGHIGHKIAATLASTGTMAFFLHPAEAIHGDLGMVGRDDLVLALSNSGSSEEVLRLLGPLRRMGVPVIAMTGDPQSELARRAELNLDVSVAQEACPMGLAPTASTTAAMAVGDAVAVCLLKLRNFRPEDYALFHPGGSLGKKLMTTVGDLMDKARLPKVEQDTPLSQAIPEILKHNYGLTSIVDRAGILQGVFSIGDFTRLHLKDPSLAFMTRPISQFMMRTPRTVTADTLAAGALNVMENHHIRALFVIDAEQRPIGVIGLYEVLKAIDY